MMKKILFFALLLISGLNIHGQVPHLSQQAEISVLTIMPGQELYSKFGHSAIRVYDPVSGIDWVFNYGTFDFNTPHFYLKFIKGKLNYMLSVQSFRSFYYEYKSERRSTYEQVLNLSYEQKKKIFNFLLWNAQPENRYYLYDFLYDNCATRVRDVLIKQLGDSLLMPNYPTGLTFRRAFGMYVKNQPWLRLGINILNGMAADKKLDLYHAMFLPDYVDSAVAQAQIKTMDGHTLALVKKAHFLYKFEQPGEKTVIFRPWIVFTIILALILWVSLREYQKQRRKPWLDFTVFFIAGLMGTVLLGLWLLTDHLVARNNLNILWLVPLHLIFAFFIIKKRPPQWVYSYAGIMRFYYLLLLVAMPLLPQEFDYNIIPLILIMIMRLQVIKSVKK